MPNNIPFGYPYNNFMPSFNGLPNNYQIPNKNNNQNLYNYFYEFQNKLLELEKRINNLEERLNNLNDNKSNNKSFEYQTSMNMM